MKTGGELNSLDQIDKYDVGGLVEASYPHYIMSMLWSTQNPATEEEEYLDENYSIENISPELEKASKNDLRKFIEANKDDIKSTGMTPEMLGHDLWLTREHHGAGFWDRGYGEAGERMTKFAHDLKGIDLELNDDKITALGIKKSGGGLGQIAPVGRMLKSGGKAGTNEINLTDWFKTIHPPYITVPKQHGTWISIQWKSTAHYDLTVTFRFDIETLDLVGSAVSYGGTRYGVEDLHNLKGGKSSEKNISLLEKTSKEIAKASVPVLKKVPPADRNKERVRDEIEGEIRWNIAKPIVLRNFSTAQYKKGGKIKYAIVNDKTNRIHYRTNDKNLVKLKLKEFQEIYPNEKIIIQEFEMDRYKKGGHLPDKQADWIDASGFDSNEEALSDLSKYEYKHKHSKGITADVIGITMSGVRVRQTDWYGWSDVKLDKPKVTTATYPIKEFFDLFKTERLKDFEQGGIITTMGISFKNTFGVDDKDFEKFIFAYYDSGSLDNVERVTARSTLFALQNKWGKTKNKEIGDYVSNKFKAVGIMKKGGKAGKSLGGFKVGDRVIINQYVSRPQGTVKEIKGQRLLVLKDSTTTGRLTEFSLRKPNWLFKEPVFIAVGYTIDEADAGGYFYAKDPITPAEPKTVDIGMTWKGAMHIYIMALQSGKEEAKRIARKELMDLAKAVDENNKKADRKYWAIFNDNELEVIDNPAEFYDDDDLPNTPQLTIAEAIKEAEENGYEILGRGEGKTGNSNAIFVRKRTIKVGFSWAEAMRIYIATIEQRTKAEREAIADLMSLAKHLDETKTLEQ